MILFITEWLLIGFLSALLWHKIEKWNFTIGNLAWSLLGPFMTCSLICCYSIYFSIYFYYKILDHININYNKVIFKF